ncbi:MAG: DNA translocase FtsK [Candidatus Yanofskybacteria bacterium]|nr:DNA translocase FtsK [Candidatus Yanofskybacteria bacterium]
MVKLKKKSKIVVPEKKESRFDISQETKNSILGLLSFVLVILSILSFVGRAGRAGNMFDMGARSLFGWGFFLIPIAFGLLGFAFIKSISRKIYFSAVLGTLLFVLASLSIFFILGDAALQVRIDQGGYLGVILGYPLFNLLGFTASFIVLVALMVISVLLALNVPLYRLVTNEEELKKSTDNIVIKQGNEALIKAVDPKGMPKVVPAKVDLTDKEFVIKNLKSGKWKLPPLELLNEDKDTPSTDDINASAMIIKRTLSNFGIDVEMGEVSIGPTVTQYTLRPAVGVKLTRISALNPDLSLALAAHPLRIEAPIPGKSLVGIEVPNKKVATVALRGLMEHDDFSNSKSFLPLTLGRDVTGSPVFASLEKMPHLLIAGATGTGKSVMINAILLSMLYRHSPDMLKFILVDPKRVELTLYNNIPHLITPVITDTKKVLGALRWAVTEMDRRYELLSKAGARDIDSYNAKLSAKKENLMPFIVIVIDELADLMASYGRDVEAAIVRLAQMSRAVGIHLIVSTQRPSVEVITGLIKANITSRIALQVASQVDSRTILDMSGAEKLLGRGDMLFVSGDASKPRRLQAPLVTEKEVKDVVGFINDQAEKMEVGTEEELKMDLDSAPAGHGAMGDGGGSEDDMYEDAKAVVVSASKASASLLQRRLRVGYARAARLLDILEENGIIGPGDGAKPREVYIKAGEGPVAQMATDMGGISADTADAEREEV